MRTETLKYVIEIAQLKSFSLAARKLFISQQGLSKAVQSVEKELGVTLFERTGKNVHLTEAGKAFLPLARRCVDAHELLQETMLQYSQDCSSETIQVLAMPFVASTLFNSLKSRLTAHGLREVVLEEKSLGDIVAAVKNPEYAPDQVAMTSLPNRMLDCLLQDSDISYIPLITAHITVVGTKALISPRKKKMTVEEMTQLPVAYYRELILERILKDAFSSDPLKNVIMRASNIQMLQEYLEEGRIVTFSDSFSDYLNPATDDLFSVPLEKASPFSVGFIYSKEKGLSREAAQYVARFKKCIEETCETYLAKRSTYAPRIEDIRLNPTPA